MIDDHELDLVNVRLNQNEKKIIRYPKKNK